MQKLVELVKEYPDLPIVAMVDGEIVEDPGMMWMGSITNALIADVGLVGNRYYDDRDDFKDAYYEKYMETFEEKPTSAEEEDEIEAYLDMKADEYMRKAIVIYVHEPDSKIFKEA